MIKKYVLLIFFLCILILIGYSLEAPSEADIFIRPRGGNAYYINLSGSEIKPWNLLRKNFYYTYPKWNPNMNIIAYAEKSNGEETIELVNSIGKSYRTIKVDGVVEDSLGWSKDGDFLAYTQKINSKYFTYFLDTLCLLEKSCTPNPILLGEGVFLDWSPFENVIVYAKMQKPNNILIQKIFMRQINSDKKKEIPFRQKKCSSFNWGINGIVMECDGNIYLIQEDGSNMRNLSNGFGGTQPKWVSDGNQIVFISQRDELIGKEIRDLSSVWPLNALYIMNFDGSDVRRLTSGRNEHILWFSILP